MESFDKTAKFFRTADLRVEGVVIDDVVSMRAARASL
jgi:hypothetical protein